MKVFTTAIFLAIITLADAIKAKKIGAINKALVKAATDSDADVRAGAAESAHSKALEALLKAADAGKGEVRVVAVRALGGLVGLAEQDDTRVFQVLLKAAKGGHGLGGVIVEAVLALGQRLRQPASAGEQQALGAIFGAFRMMYQENPVGAALIALGGPAERGNEEALQLLLKGMRFIGNREAACEGLAGLAEKGNEQALEALFKATVDIDEDVRRAASKAFGAAAEKHNMLAIFLKAVTDSSSYLSENVRRAAVEALGNPAAAGNKEAIEALLKSVTDSDPKVREAAVWALRGPAGEGNEEALEALLKGTTDSHGNVRMEAVRALGQPAAGGDQRALEALLEALKDSSLDVLSTLLGLSGRLQALEEYQRPLTVASEKLTQEQKRFIKDYEQPKEITQQLKRVEKDQAEALLKGFNNISVDVRLAALEALVGPADKGNEQALEALFQATVCTDEDVRRIASEGFQAAFGAAAGRDTTKSFEASLKVLSDGNVEVRRAAVMAVGVLAEQGHTQALDALLKSVNDSDPKVSAASVWALRGPAGKGDVQAVEATQVSALAELNLADPNEGEKAAKAKPRKAAKRGREGSEDPNEAEKAAKADKGH